MKKLIYIIALISLSACTQYLDIKPYGKTIPKTPEEFSALLNNHLRDIDYGEENIIGNLLTCTQIECYSDNLDGNLTRYPAGNFIPLYIGFDLSSKQQYYSRLYAIIRDCNIIKDNMNKDKSQESSDVLGTAYAIRGICYYNLLRNFCEPCWNNYDGMGVPLVTVFDMEAKPGRSSIKQTIDLCVGDMKKAISYNIKDPMYRFNTDVMEAYLARTYFWACDYDNAIDYAKKVLDKHPLLTIDEYKEMIKDPNTHKGNILLKSQIITNSSSEIESSAAVGATRARPISKKFVDIFIEKENDVRYGLSIGKKRVFNKLPFAGVRSAEMQLILAESLYHKGDNNGALKALNELRRKRILNYTDYTMDNLPKVNSEAIIQKDCEGKELTPLIYAILCERQKELFMEGDRWFELKRNGKPEFWVAKQGRKYTTYSYMYTFPLPINDVLLAKGLIQNPGYEKVK